MKPVHQDNISVHITAQVEFNSLVFSILKLIPNHRGKVFLYAMYDVCNHQAPSLRLYSVPGISSSDKKKRDSVTDF